MASFRPFIHFVPGEVLDHPGHGRGTCQGITRIQLNGVADWYLVIAYSRNHLILYVPLPKAHRVTRPLNGHAGSRSRMTA